MKIDVFNHVLPPRYRERMERLTTDREMAKRTGRIPTLWDIEARLRLLDAFPDVQQVISLSGPPIDASAPPDVASELVRLANDEMAELTARHRDRFPAFIASLPMNHPEAALREIDRALDELGARAVQIYTNVQGRPLDDPEFFPILEHLWRRQVPIFLHPARTAAFADYPAERRSRYELWWAFGWPYETSVAMARLVFSGILDRLPGLTVVTHHMGGMVPYFEGRISPGLDVLGERTVDETYTPLRRPPIAYFKEFYADTALFGAQEATRLGLSFFGQDRCLFASDAPFDPEGGARFLRDTIRILDALLDDEGRKRIYEDNARRLLRL